MKNHITTSQISTKIISLLLILLSNMLITFSSADINNLRLTRLSTNEGLSQSQVNSLLIDKEGFLWLATEGGLNHYDGYEIKQLAGPENSFLDAPIQNLFQDSTGLIWISTTYSGLYSFNPLTREYNQLIKYDDEIDQSLSQVVEHIVEDSVGNLWLAKSRNVLLYDRKLGTLNSVFDLPDIDNQFHIIRRLISKDNLVFIATSKGLFVLNKTTKLWKQVPLFKEQTVTPDQLNAKELFIDSNNELWIGTVEGLYSISVANISKFITEQSPLADITKWVNFRNIWRLSSNDNGFYIATDDGLYTLSVEDKSLTRVFRFSESKHEVSDNNIRDMQKDKNGNLWLASSTGGAFYWKASSTNFINVNSTSGASQALSNDTVWSLFEDVDNELWIGTHNGLNRLNLKTKKLDSFLISDDKKAIVSSGSISQIIEDNDDMLWLVTGDGLTHFNKKTAKKETLVLNDPEHVKTFKLANWGYSKDKDGRLWFITEKGYHIYNPKDGSLEALDELTKQVDVTTAYTFLGSLPNHPESMLLSADGHLWQYNYESKKLTDIYQLDADKHKSYMAPDSWVIDKSNTLWITFPSYGLVGLDANNFDLKHQFNTSNILPTNVIYGLALDEDDDLWLSSHLGVFHLDSDNHHIEQFTYGDGIAENEFNGGAHKTLKDGRVVYGSMKGITLFDPNEFKSKDGAAIDYSNSITDVSLLSRSLVSNYHNMDGENILLDYDDIGIRISFSTLDFDKQKDTSYKIQITGSQELSYPEAKENFIMFPKLNPGDYSLSVIAINPTTGKSSAPAKLTIKVKYAPFASPTAYSIYFLLSILLISIWNYRRRLQRQRLLSAHQNVMENQERLQLALKGSNSGEFDWHCDDNLIFEHRIHDELGHEELPNPIPFKQHLDLVHPDDIKRYKSLWQAFTNHPDKKFECIYRLRNSDNSWQWYRDLARVASRNADGTAERITGAYTNITNTRGNEEKARLFGEAFKQTRDWVAILDKYGVPITTNKAFYVSLGISKDDLISSLEDSLGLNESRKRYYRHVFQTLKPNGHWQGETLIVSKTGNKFPSLIKMNAISADGKHIDNYVIIMTDISEQKAAEEKLKQLAHFDSLTGLPNRLFLLERIEHAINNANRNDNNMAVLFIDLDRFKQINDSLGHEVGDIVLKTIAQRLRNILRKSDTVARLGGDEFVVLLESFDALEHITRIAEKIINGIDEPLKLENSQIRLSPSIGISLYPDDAKNSSDLIKFADVAMYHSKEVGGRSFRFFNESMNQHAKQRFELENKIKQAHLDNEFINYYQPIVDTNSEKIVGFELLLRWQSKEGLVSPAKFISIAEEIALIIPMTITALNQGLADLSLWHKIDPSLYLSVNLAARHLEQMSLVDDVIKALQKSNIHSSRLRFEITEGTLMKDHKKSIQTMMELNKIGVELYLDDFGTGYSSLQYLKRLPINVIKIDRSFIKDIGIDENNEAIVEAILLMANSLKKYCIAEGVETKEQLHFMIEHDCNLIQGYIFSKPLPVEYIAKLLERKLDFS